MLLRNSDCDCVGFRGKNAYHHETAEQIDFKARNQIAFPAVTICPLHYQTKISPISCVKQTALEDVRTKDDCKSPIYYRNVTVRGIEYRCITANDPKGIFVKPYPVLQSESLSDQIKIVVTIDTTSLPFDSPIGALVMIHSNLTNPILSQGSSFEADVGRRNLALMKKYTHQFLNGSSSDTFTISSSSVTLPSLSNNRVEVIVTYTDQGIYEAREYYVYTIYNWFGEVGGFACLMWLLQLAVVFIIENFSRLIIKNKEQAHVALEEIK